MSADRPFWQWSAGEIADAVDRGDVAVDDVVAAHEAQAAAWDPVVHAFLHRIPGGRRPTADGSARLYPSGPGDRRGRPHVTRGARRG